MPPTFIPAPGEVVAILDDLIDEYRPDIKLNALPLDIKILFAIGDEGKPPLKKGGWPAEALVSVPGALKRAAGEPDVLIVIDEAAWAERSHRQRIALVHHELHHIELVKAKKAKNDDGSDIWHSADDVLGRLKVKLKKHDWELGGFKYMAELYGDDAAESVAYKRVSGLMEQETFDFARA